MVVCQGELPFSIDDKGGEKEVGRGVMITGGVLVLPSMPKGDIFLSMVVIDVNPRSTKDDPKLPCHIGHHHSWFIIS